MRKNKMMRVASALMVAVLLTTCAISSTFAKYVTTDEFTDQARVAKWGVELQIVGNLYGDTYGASDKLVVNNDATISVQAADAVLAEGSDVVAPGTLNAEGMTISLKGTPEVDGTIDVDITTSNIYLRKGTYGVMVPVIGIDATNYDEYYNTYNANGSEELFTSTDGLTFAVAGTAFLQGVLYYTIEDKYTLNDDNYYPVVYTLVDTINTSTTYTPTANVYTTDTLSEVAAKIMSNFNYSSQPVQDASGVTTYTVDDVPFASTTDLSDEFKLEGIKLTWAWAFENTNANSSDYNGADTILGLIQDGINVVKLSGNDYVPVVNITDYCLNTALTIDITVEQANNNVKNHN